MGLVRKLIMTSSFVNTFDICNTSSMPIAARESSIYTGITIAEYYRMMGISVLLLADSTSRWAQALRETSGRLGEIPGEEAFPAYLDSNIKGIYERAGHYQLSDKSHGSLTFLGTVSPAGGNFEEPVTQSTLSTVKNFLGLSYNRAYKKFYPAIEPLISWSKYFDQLEPYFKKEFHANWVKYINQVQSLIFEADQIYQMMQVSGEEGIAMEDYISYQKYLFFDMVYLQQDAFDLADAFCSKEEQKQFFLEMIKILDQKFHFTSKKDVYNFFIKLTSMFKNRNYAEFKTDKYNDLTTEINQFIEDQIKLSKDKK